MISTVQRQDLLVALLYICIGEHAKSCVSVLCKTLSPDVILTRKDATILHPAASSQRYPSRGSSRPATWPWQEAATGSNQESTQAIPIRELIMCNWDHHTPILRGGSQGTGAVALSPWKEMRYWTPYLFTGQSLIQQSRIHRPWTALFPSTLRSSKWGLLGARRTAATPDTHPKVCRLKQTSTPSMSCISACYDPSHVSSTTGSGQSLLSQASDSVLHRKGNSKGHLGTLSQPPRLLALSLQMWGYTWGYYTLGFLNAVALLLKIIIILVDRLIKEHWSQNR